MALFWTKYYRTSEAFLLPGEVGMFHGIRISQHGYDQEPCFSSIGYCRCQAKMTMMHHADVSIIPPSVVEEPAGVPYEADAMTRFDITDAIAVRCSQARSSRAHSGKPEAESEVSP